jgi:hypothetical protein
MKTVTKSISLTEELANFAKQEAEEGCYGNVSAYFADLIRQRRQARIEADVKLLADGVKDAPNGAEPSEEIVALPGLSAVRCSAKSGSRRDPGGVGQQRRGRRGWSSLLQQASAGAGI